MCEHEHGPWYAIWTHSHCEQLVNDQLASKGFELFLPKAQAWSERAGRRHQVFRPLFPGYLFVRHPLDKLRYVEVISARGVVRVLGDRWDALAPIQDEELEGIRRAIASGASVMPYQHLTEGDRVRIKSGPLEGVEGLFVRSRPTKGLLVLSVRLLQRSVAVEVPCSQIQETT
jgi:transcription antitermination factor NusG